MPFLDKGKQRAAEKNWWQRCKADQICYENYKLKRIKKAQKERAQASPERKMWLNLHKRRKRGQFNVTVADIHIPKTCPILGIPLDSRDRDHTPSVDRVDNSKGYVRENIQVISTRANRMKGAATIDELKAIIQYMEAHNAHHHA